MDEHDVTQVDLGLPGIERLLADPVEADHGLQLRSVTLLQGREAQFPGVAGEDHPAGDAHLFARSGVGGQVRIGRTQLGQGVRTGHLCGIGLVPLGEQPFALVLTNPELLGDCVGIGVARNVSHDVPA